METISPLKAWTQKSQNVLLVKGITKVSKVSQEKLRFKEGGYTDSP